MADPTTTSATITMVPTTPIPAHVYLIMWARSPSETSNRTHGRPVFAMPTFAKAKYWLEYECQMIKHSTAPAGREVAVISDPITQIAELRHRVKVPMVGRAPEAHMVFVNYYWIEMIKVQPDDGEEKIGSWRK